MKIMAIPKSTGYDRIYSGAVVITAFKKLKTSIFPTPLQFSSYPTTAKASVLQKNRRLQKSVPFCKRRFWLKTTQKSRVARDLTAKNAII